MSLTNNGKFRRYRLTVNKKINGSLQTTDGFPKIHELLDSFGSYPAITISQFEVLSDANYNFRLNSFYDFLETTYSFFTRNSVLNASNATDQVLCPLDNTATPTVNIASDPQGSFQLLMGDQGQTISNLVWSIEIDSVAQQDISYSFSLNIRDKNNNILRNQIAYGIIRQGNTTHDSFAEDGDFIYFPEGEDSSLAPLIAEYIPGSVSLNQ